MADTFSKKLIAQYFSNLPYVAENNKWKAYYDEELDNFYFTSPKLSKESSLYSLNNEISLYLTSKGVVEGIFIEYFTSNFLQHEKAFSKFLELLKKGKKSEEKKNQQSIYEKALITHVMTEFQKVNPPANI